MGLLDGGSVGCTVDGKLRRDSGAGAGAGVRLRQDSGREYDTKRHAWRKEYDGWNTMTAGIRRWMTRRRDGYDGERGQEYGTARERERELEDGGSTIRLDGERRDRR